MQKKETILLLLSERIGDVIFCTPAIKLLSITYPHSKIEALTPSQAAEQVILHNPAIHKIHVDLSDKQISAMAKNYSMVIDLHNNRTTEKWRNLLQHKATYVNPRKGLIHQSQVATHFIAEVLNISIEDPISAEYKLYPQQQHNLRSEGWLREHDIDLTQHMLVGCHMGSHTTTRRGWKFWKPLTGEKCWPISAFGEVMQNMTENNPMIRFVLTGTPSEIALAKKLKKYYPDSINLIGKTSVLDLAALMPFFRVFLTGDTGPMHIASAMNTPIVGLFGPTEPEHTGPFPMRPHHIILKANNLPEISTQTVINALECFV